MSPLVSVIVPVYNLGIYLEKCINSILNQTYSNLEIILVDDGSTDNSCEVCDRFAEMDDRVKVIHKQNGGVVNARKTGIDAANGELVGYVDADDWIEPDFYSTLVGAYLTSGADMVTSAHFHEIGEKASLVENGIAEGSYRVEDILGKILCNGRFYEYGINPHLWSKIFRRDKLLECQLAVDSGIKCGDDAAVVYPFLLNADRVCVTSYVGYHYVQHPNSLTKERDTNEAELMSRLFAYLSECVYKSRLEPAKLSEVLRQLDIYKNYMYALRDISYLDKEDELLQPYGGLEKGEKIVIYGAGVLGQMIYKYLSERNEVCIAAWLDKNAEEYESRGMDVKIPEAIIDTDFDKVLIANITYGTAMKIKEYIVKDLKIPDSKVYWFSEEFQKGNVI